MKTKISQSDLLIQNPKHADNRVDPWLNLKPDPQPNHKYFKDKILTGLDTFRALY